MKAERRARAAAQKREREKDTRRKLLLGAMHMENLKNGDSLISEEALKAGLDVFLKRDTDRALFGLPPLGSGKILFKPESVKGCQVGRPVYAA